jgi:hypothetical protein
MDTLVEGPSEGMAVDVDAHIMGLLGMMEALTDNAVAALATARMEVEDPNVLVKTGHPAVVVAILMMNHVYHMSYLNNYHKRSTQFSYKAVIPSMHKVHSSGRTSSN